MSQKSLSVIVPAFNEEKLIGRSLQAIQAALAPLEQDGWRSEVIVCDNNSTDRTAELARAAGARVVFEPQNQIARARNRGAEAATGDYLLFVDADSFPSAGLLAEAAEVLAGGNCLGGGALVQLDEHHWLAARVTRFWNWLSRRNTWAAGSFIFCQAQAFRQLGGFSTELYAAEEIEFSKRLNRLARASGKATVILTRHPLLTSARKLHLYSGPERLWFVLRAALRPGATLSQRETCEMWYDGRR
jgi:glycosyltransferase involved in cell wall biosynthesis